MCAQTIASQFHCPHLSLFVHPTKTTKLRRLLFPRKKQHLILKIVQTNKKISVKLNKNEIMLFTEHFLSFFSYVNTVLPTESIFHMLFLWVYVYTYMYIHVTEEKDNVTNLNLTPSNIPVVISEGQTVVS